MSRLTHVLPSTVVVSTVVAGLAALLVGCGEAPKPQGGGQMPPPPVGIATPIARNLPTTRELTGRLEAMQSVELRTRVGGTITEVLVADGAEVKAGDVLFRIDDEPLKASLAKAEADVARAAARLTQAKQQLDRARKLVADKIVSQQAFDDAESALAAATADQAAADAAVLNARLDLSHATITAPIAGRIGKVLATVGNLAQASGPAPGTLLASLVGIDPLYTAFDLDEETWRLIGTRLRASADAKGAGDKGVPVRLGLPGEQGFPHSGVVTFVDNQIDTASGSIRIRATVANADRALTPGAFARIQLEIAPPAPVLLINERTVQAQQMTRYVLVVDDKGGTSFRPVQLLGAADGLRIVTGLAPTDHIAVNNLTKIFYPGMPVTPVPASMVTLQNDAPPAGAPGAAPAGAPAAEKPATEKPAAAKPEGAAKAEGTKP
jgi:RND family efflux transporter MFP subunit